MSDEQNSTIEAIQSARASLIAGGVNSVSSGGTSVSYMTLEALEQAQQREEVRAAAAAEGPFCGKVVSAHYDGRW